ncbi:type II toxin-antitoxin system VapC family toxin [Candidatus Azambacteria bacterium]|nr:type II toxin-antitoxin system VapC family toxin [Candidatus Azambacteria bacterium]
MYTLDTNTIIYYSKDDSNVEIFLENIFSQNIPIYISVITEIELLGFSNLTDQDIEWFENFLKTLTIIPVESRIARIAGMLRRKYRVKTMDSVIASTALITGTTLVTRNINDFKKIPGLLLKKI